MSDRDLPNFVLNRGKVYHNLKMKRLRMKFLASN
jgi:hypothetical protein